MHEPFDDAILGRVAWNTANDCWDFEAGPVEARAVPADYYPADISLSPAEHGWDGVRACVRWVRANGAAAREYVAAKLFQGWLEGWYDPEIDAVTTLKEFQGKFELSGITFFEDQEANLIYNDGNLFGGHGFSLKVNAAGEFVAGPDMFG